MLEEEDLHGYELKRRLAGLLGSRAAVSFGSLYPALGRLERDGFVKAVDARTEAAPLPMTGSLGAEVAAFRARSRLGSRGQRNKKVYGITPAGERRLLELLAEPGADDRTFAVQVALFDHLAHEQRLVLLASRRVELAARLAAVDAPQPAQTPATAGPRARFREAVRERERATIRSELAWLDRLLEEEAAAGPGSPDTTGAPATTSHPPLSTREGPAPHAVTGGTTT